MTRSMCDEDFFHDVLDENELNHAARFLLTEWLAERGDSRCEGIAWLVSQLIVPQDDTRTATWDWNDGEYFDRLTGAIPHHVFEKLSGGRLSETGHYREYPSRRTAEDAFCHALLRPEAPPINDLWA